MINLNNKGSKFKGVLMPSKPSKAYIIQTTLKPNKIYSCFGIKIRVKEEVDTFSNEGNFEIHIRGINLKDLEAQSKGKITRDTPIFCYNQHSKELSVAKLANSTVSIRTNLNEELINQAKLGLIKPCFLNLSFVPLTNNYEANNKASQKIQLTSDDINKGYITVEFKLPLKFLGEWEGIELSKDDKNQGEYNQAFQIVDDNGCGLPNIPYKISTECGIEYEGITDNNGYTQRIYTQNAQNLNIEILG